MRNGKKSIIITGGNTGLGYEAAKRIASTDASWQIILASRSRERVEQAAQQLIQTTGHTDIVPMVLDLSSWQSIYRFADQLKRAEAAPLHAIICNAGSQFVQGTSTTVEGIEATFGVNHLGHYLLIRLLLEQLEEPGQIIVVSSDTHDPGKKTGMPRPKYLTPERMADPLQSDAAFAGLSANERGQTRYTTSKLCNLYFTYELSRRMEQAGRRISVNAFNPGMMPGAGSSLARDYSPLMRFMWNHVLPLMRYVRSSVRSTQQSGADLANLVLDKNMQNVKGKYYDGPRIIPSSEESYREDRARELWEWSAAKLGLAVEI